MRIKEILLAALSLVLIVCLVLLGRSCAAERAAILETPEPTPAPTPVRKPIPTFAPSPTPEPTPQAAFAERMGWFFEEPQEHTIPTVQFASAKAVEYSAVRAIVSAPQITRSEPDEEGFVTYEIRYTTMADAHFTKPTGEECKVYYILAGGYDLFDYESGRMLNCRDAGDLGDERTYTRETLLPSGLVQVTEDAFCTWDEWQMTEKDGRVAMVNQAVVKAYLTVRAPEDYDGLVLGLDVVNTEELPDALLDGETPAEESPETWSGKAADWAFIRADDWLSTELEEEEEEADETDEAEEEEADLDGEEDYTEEDFAETDDYEDESEEL